MEDIFQDTSISYVTAQMARRLVYQMLFLKKAEKERHICNAIAEEGYEELPRGWMAVANDWCDDHNLNRVHGAMMLLHLQSIFGRRWSKIELRVILDDAYERAQKIEIPNGRVK